MTKRKKHKWTFSSRFRRNAFGWRSSKLASQRIKEAVAEIKKTARKEPETAAEGAVLFFEKVAPAIEHVDSSSGALGGAVNRAKKPWYRSLHKRKQTRETETSG